MYDDILPYGWESCLELIHPQCRVAHDRKLKGAQSPRSWSVPFCVEVLDEDLIMKPKGGNALLLSIYMEDFALHHAAGNPRIEGET